MCDHFKEDFTLDKIIGEGGSSFVILAEANYKLKSYGLEKLDKIVIKLCKPYLTELACSLFDKEAYHLKTLTSIRKHTFNYPKFYGLRHCCLFVEGEAREKILKWSKKFTLTNDIFIYSNTRHDIPFEVVDKVKNIFPAASLLSIREDLKVDNFSILLQMSQSSTEGVMDFILDEQFMGCSYFIMLSHLQGKSFSEIPLDGITDGEFMDMVYGIIAAAKYAKFILKDIHDDNIMQIYIPTPRAYIFGEDILVIPPGYGIVYIDAQVVEETPATLSVNTLMPLTRISSRLTTKAQKLLYEFLKAQRRTLSLDQIAQSLVTSFSSYKVTREELLDLKVRYPDLPVAEW